MIPAGRTKESSELTGLLLEPVQAGLGTVAVEFEEPNLHFSSDHSVSVAAAISDALGRATESLLHKPEGSSQETVKEGVTVDGG